MGPLPVHVLRRSRSCSSFLGSASVTINQPISFHQVYLLLFQQPITSVPPALVKNHIFSPVVLILLNGLTSAASPTS